MSSFINAPKNTVEKWNDCTYKVITITVVDTDYFDILNPNQFDMRDSEGAVIEKTQIKQ